MEGIMKKKRIFSTLILVIALAVLGISLYKIYTGKMEYKKGRDEYSRIREEAIADKYLNKSFGENYIKAGTIFVNCDNKKDFTDWNTIIYGHNMNDGSMFASLKKYEDAAYRKKHPTFDIYTPDDVRHTYRIFAVGTYAADSSAATQYGFADRKDYARFLKEIRDGALYDTSVKVTADNRIVTLYTCTNVREADRWLVFGVWTGDK